MTRESRSILKDTWGAVFLVAIPIIVGILLIWYGFDGNYATVHGRYRYTGTEEMSMFGLLDTAHFRNIATEELLGWQFFFGNLPFFTIYALVIAGFLHVARPRAVHDGGTEPVDIEPGKGLKRIGMVSGIVVLFVLVAEVVLSVAGAPQIGLGSHIFVGDFYRDIPTLLLKGYIPTNNIPAIPQTLMTVIPFACGLGIVLYTGSLANFRNQGIVAKHVKIRPAAIIMLVIALAWWAIIASGVDFRVPEAMTGYSIALMAFLLLNTVAVTGIMIPVTRAMLPAPKRAPRPFLSPLAFIIAIAAVAAMIASAVLVAWPFLPLLEIEIPAIPGLMIYQGLAIGSMIALVTFLVVLSRKDHVEVIRVVSFFGGCFSLLMFIVYFAANTDGGDMELMWLYNLIIPSIFINALVIAFYVLGFKINAWIQLARHFISKKISGLIKPVDKRRARQLEASMVIVLVTVCAVAAPAIIGWKMLGDHPRILINNVGMLPGQEKTFFLTLSNDLPSTSGSFDVVDASGTIVHSGVLGYQGLLWQKYNWKGNFSTLDMPGVYRVVARLGQHVAWSNEFTIDSHYLDAARSLGLYWFYYARCGTKVEPVQHNAIGHEACHQNDAWYLYNNSGTYEYRHDLDLTGGWHDSGDYNTYGAMMAMATPSG